MHPDLQKVHDAQKEARTAAEKDIIWQYINKPHELGPYTRAAKDGVIEISLKYLKSVMPFFSERTIQQALYVFQDEGRVVADRDKGFGSCIKWYRIR